MCERSCSTNNQDAMDDFEQRLFAAKWAACNLHMQLIRCIETHQLKVSELHVAHAESVNDRVTELENALYALMEHQRWPEDASKDDEE